MNVGKTKLRIVLNRPPFGYGVCSNHSPTYRFSRSFEKRTLPHTRVAALPHSRSSSRGPIKAGQLASSRPITKRLV